MALFGKFENLNALLRRVKNLEYEDTAELLALLARLEADPELTPKQVAWMAGHRRAEVRAFAGRVFRDANDEATVDLLVREMASKPGPIRAEIASLAVDVSPKRVYRALGYMTSARQPEQRLSALDLIKASPNRREYRSHLRAALNDTDARVRRKTVEILSTEPDDPTVRLFLIGLLRDGDTETRRTAIETLAAHPAADVVEPFLERMPYEDTRGQTVMVQALQSLAHDPEARLADQLLPMLADDSEEVQEAAIRLLREFPDRTEVVRAYLRFTHGLAFWLRDRSYQMFLRISHDILEPVMELLGDENPEIRIGAILLAADSKKKKVVPALFEILRSQDDWWVRVVAAEALVRFPSPEVTQELIDQLHDPDTRYAVVSALGQLKNTKAVPALVGCLGDPDPIIRMATLDALDGMRLPGVADAIARMVTSDADVSVQEKALVVLHNLGGVAKDRVKTTEAILHERERDRERELRRTLELEMVNPNL